MSLKIKYYGVRGSLPVSGAQFDEFGGNTTCCFIEHEKTRIIIDAGTGIRPLGLDLMKTELPSNGGELHLYFTHTHWDHIQGFPFFIPAFLSKVDLHIYGETKEVTNHATTEIWDIERILKNQQHFIYFPVETKDMPARKTYHTIDSKSELKIGKLRIKCLNLQHPNSAMAFRFESDQTCFVFATDVEHSEKMTEALAHFAKDADVLAYDCQYTEAEYAAGKVGWGHSTYEKGIDICKKGNIKKLHMIHHDPLHADMTLRQMEQDAKKLFPESLMIRENSEFQL